MPFRIRPPYRKHNGDRLRPRQRANSLHQCNTALHPAVQRLKCGGFRDVTLGELEDFVTSLGDEAWHLENPEAISSSLSLALCETCYDEDVRLTAQICRSLTQRVTSSRESQILHRSKHVVQRDALVRFMAREVEVGQRIRSLPLLFVYLLIFLCLVVLRLRIWERQEHERGLEAWVTGNSKELYGPYLMDHVNNMDTFWGWLNDSGLFYTFGDVRMETGLPQVHLASTSILIGDILIERHLTDGSFHQEWLLHTTTARVHLANHSRDILAAARSASNDLKLNGWASKDIDELKITFCTCSKRARMFAITDIMIPFGEYGFVRPRVIASAVTNAAYRDTYTIIVDVAYALLLFYLMWDECMDLYSLRRRAKQMIRVSHDIGSNVQEIGRQITEGKVKPIHMLHVSNKTGVCDVYNALKHFTLASGILIIVLWLLYRSAINADTLLELLDDSGQLKSEVMSFDTRTLEQVAESVRKAWRFLFALTIVMAANIVSIMFRFFKAFRVNPRLETVTETLVRSAGDIGHFSLVFLTVFLCYALLGHMLFGQDLPEFFSIGAAVDTSVQTLLGDFDWYVQFNGYRLTNLPSGMPRPVLALWFYSYMFLVMLVLLNMIVAIIFERYQEVIDRMKEQGEVPSIWTQLRRFVQNRKESKGFTPAYKLLALLQDSESPAHPQELVSEKSLLAAFPAMPHKQAAWLIENILGQSADASQEDTRNDSNQDALFQNHLANDNLILAAIEDKFLELRQDLGIAHDIRQHPSGTSLIHVKSKKSSPQPEKLGNLTDIVSGVKQ